MFPRNTFTKCRTRIIAVIQFRPFVLVPSQITSIPDNTRKRPSPSTDVQAVSQPSSKEFDPLSTQKAMDVDHQQNKVISSFGLSNDTGGKYQDISVYHINL